MYKLTWMFFAFISLVLPVLSSPAPMPAPEEHHELQARMTNSGTWYSPEFDWTYAANQLVEAMTKNLYDRIRIAESHYGRGTWYYPGLGNCGWNNNAQELVVAIPKTLYDRNGGRNCGQMVQISYQGKSVQAKTVDSCPGCGTDGLDMSPATFEHLAPLSVGVLQIEWHFM
ncbi:RlpA-like double-psi beta-barrel-protein domain-containing protein-containing protein [Lactifluus volemus]|nr:RlpA-like double-psi beta-barrel-protein domain-containing protein-containing protein [Lactifluus volemus]